MDSNSLIFAFGDDAGVTVYDDADKACRDWEGIDVESSVVVFYSSDGSYLKPIFDKPNKKNKCFWIFTTIENGAYHLEKQATPTDVDPLWLLVFESVYLNPNPWIKDLSELKVRYPRPD